MIEDCALKIERANRHIAELENLISDHAVQHPPVVDPQFGDDGGLVHVDVRVAGLPPMSSAIIGDVIHNLRAALDLLAVALVKHAGGNPKDVLFPFARNASHLEDMIKSKNFDRAGEKAVERLRSLRPYVGGNESLRALHDLDVQDKHKAIIPIGAMISTPQVTVDHVNFDTGKAKLKLVEGSMPEVRQVFPPGSTFEGAEIVPTLRDLVVLVRDIISSFSETDRGTLSTA